MAYLFDSNVLIYHLNGELNTPGKALLKAGLLGNGAYSIISKIEGGAWFSAAYGGRDAGKAIIFKLNRNSFDI